MAKPSYNDLLDIIARINSNGHYVEIHPLSADPATWGDQDNWKEIAG